MSYSDMSSSVIVNGHTLKEFEIGRGCRQGDPLSPYLFVLCADILAIMIRNNKNIRGITVDEVEFKLTQYADDTTLILDGFTRNFKLSYENSKYFSELVWFENQRAKKHQLFE